MPRYYAPTCKACPDGKSTVAPGATHDSLCVGYAAKYLNPSFCNSSSGGIGVSTLTRTELASRYLNDEGSIKRSDLEIVEAGALYLDGLLVFDTAGTPGEGAVVTFQVSSPQGGVETLQVQDGGKAYSSTGSVAPYFASIDDNFVPGKLQTDTVAALTQRPFENLRATADSFMSGCIAGSITAPTAARASNASLHQPTGFLGHYSADSVGSIHDICFGRLSGSVNNPICHRNLDNHGSDYPQNPELLVEDRGIRNIRVRQDVLSYGCARNGRMMVSEGGRPSAIFQAQYSSSDDGRLVGIEIYEQDAALGAQGRELAAFPDDAECKCGSGIEELQILDHGFGFVPGGKGQVYVVDFTALPCREEWCRSPDGDGGFDCWVQSWTQEEFVCAGGFRGEATGKAERYGNLSWIHFTCCPPAEDGNGQGFSGSFTSNSSGHVVSVAVSNPGHGYSSGLALAVCPEGTEWNVSLACCYRAPIIDTLLLRYGVPQVVERNLFPLLSVTNPHNRSASSLTCLRYGLPQYALRRLPAELQSIENSYDATTGCFVLQQPTIAAQVGKAGGVPGNFDACLEVEVDLAGCRCGSGLEEISIVAPGFGYVNGPVEPLFEAPPCCSHPEGCPESLAPLETVPLVNYSCGWDVNGTALYIIYVPSTGPLNMTNASNSSSSPDANLSWTLDNLLSDLNISGNASNTTNGTNLIETMSPFNTSTLNSSQEGPLTVCAVNVSWCGEYCNHSCVLDCLQPAENTTLQVPVAHEVAGMNASRLPAPAEFITCFSSCWRRLNYTNPMWCSQTGRGFNSSVFVHDAENISSEFCAASPERYRQCSIPFSGRAHTVTLEGVGTSYNLSNTRLALMYPPGEGHKCRHVPCHAHSNSSLCNQSSVVEEACEQNTTIRDVFFAGNVSSGGITWDGVLGSTCEGISNCSGSGLAGTCHVNYTQICYSRNNCPLDTGGLGASSRGTVREVRTAVAIAASIPCMPKSTHQAEGCLALLCMLATCPQVASACRFANFLKLCHVAVFWSASRRALRLDWSCKQEMP